MHWRNACELYGVERCDAKHRKLFNSGVMLLSQPAHSAMLSRGWERDAQKLQCRVLCDQLYLNALLVRDAGGALMDLGPAFNYVGSELRRALVNTPTSTTSDTLAAQRRAALRAACVLHLTRKVPKLYTVDWAARRALSGGARGDVLQCSINASWPSSAGARAARRRALRAKLPKPLPPGKYDIGQVLCQGEAQGCALFPWVAAGGSVGPV